MNNFSRPNFYILTGCSGGGKSTLLSALGKQGFLCVEETGRTIVRQQEAIGGNALPWKDLSAFCELTLSHNICNFERVAENEKSVFFDRGIPEAVGIDHMLDRKPIPHHVKAAEIYRYNPCVFVLPPWPGIFVNDDERKHGFDAAVREYDIQRKIYEECGYTLIDVPKTGIDMRVAFVLDYIFLREANTTKQGNI